MKKSLTPYTDSLKEKEPEGTLILTVKQPWFNLMCRENHQDRKDFEVRDPSKWIKSRLYTKSGECRNYKYVKIINGYRRNSPYFICEFHGFATGYKNDFVFNVKGKNIELTVKPDQFIIFLGAIVERKNILSDE